MSDTKGKLRWQYQRGRDIGSLVRTCSQSGPLHARNNLFLVSHLRLPQLLSPSVQCPSFLYRSGPCYLHRDRGSRTSISNVSPRQGTQPTHVDSSPYAYSVRTTTRSPVSREVPSLLPQRTRLDVAVRSSFALRTLPDEKCLDAGAEREDALLEFSPLSPPHLRPSPRPCV